MRRAFAGKVAPVNGELKERLVGVEDDSSDEESDGEEGGADVANGNGEGWESMDED